MSITKSYYILIIFLKVVHGNRKDKEYPQNAF